MKEPILQMTGLFALAVAFFAGVGVGVFIGVAA